jgi:tetratricopeptide (TPR) repeat protein
METQAALIIYPREHFAIAVLMNFEGAVPYPYAEKLYKAVLGELWQINVYTKLASDRPTLRGMSEAFTYGMQYFEQHGKPLTTDDKELADAFTYFNSIPTLPGDDAAQRVTNGRHPQANQAFVRMASFMASRLSAANSRTFNDYFRRGMIPFFADYIRLYKSDPSVPAGLRFTPKFEEQVNAWDREWARTWNDSTRDLEISVGTDLESAGRLMRESFAGASLYPNFEPAIESLTDSLVVQGETAKALRSATLAAEIYPESAMANLELGMTTILAGDYDKALAAFRKAKEADPAEASPGTFNRFAYYLAEYASPESAVRMLEAAVELYPRDANLYDSIGELALKLGQKEKAIRSYQKALEIDPNYTNAAGAREALKKLGQR